MRGKGEASRCNLDWGGMAAFEKVGVWEEEGKKDCSETRARLNSALFFTEKSQGRGQTGSKKCRGKKTD